MLERIIEELPDFLGYYNLLFLGKALLGTFVLSAAGCLVGFGIGFVIAALRRAEAPWLWPLKGLAIAFVELFRRIPFLVTLMLVFFIFQLSGVDLSTVQRRHDRGLPDRHRVHRRDRPKRFRTQCILTNGTRPPR